MDIDLKKLTRYDFNSLSEIDQFIEFTREENTLNPTKYSWEWWAGAAYIFFIISNDSSLVPVSLIKSERPDFIIALPSQEIKLETTFCTEQRYEQAQRICKKINDGSYPINTMFMRNNDDDYRFDNSFIQNPNDPIYDRTFGNLSVNYTLRKLDNTIKQKIDSYSEIGREIRLAIYVNLPSKINLSDRDKNYIKQTLSSNKEYQGTFESIELLWDKNFIVPLDII